jgi:hypothetical protein
MRACSESNVNYIILLLEKGASLDMCDTIRDFNQQHLLKAKSTAIAFPEATHLMGPHPVCFSRDFEDPENLKWDINYPLRKSYDIEWEMAWP